MARPQNRKRQRVDDSPQANTTNPPTKKIRTRSEIELDAWWSWEYPPEFWDRLSKIELTHRALKELDRRTRTRRSHPSPPASPSGLILSRATTNPRDLARFARLGGPDFSDLRGYPQPSPDRQPSVAMSESRSSRSRRTKSTDPTSTLPTTLTTTKTKKSTPYNRDFDLHLTDHQVYPTYSSKRPNLTQVKTELAVPRPSLSPSKFSDGAFDKFQENNARAKDEDEVLANVIPTILGPSEPSHASARNTVFGNLEPLTDGTIASAKPDIYFGAYPEELSRLVRDELSTQITPSTMQDKPMAPNFFFEAKGPDGSAAVAIRQARYDGAIGSRAMHSLQNYGEEEPRYDGNTYTFSSTYQDGLLKMFVHHPTAPVTEEGRQQYHMTQTGAYAMTNTRETFVEGATALRNARDLSKRYRDSFIRAANTKASLARTSTGQDVHETYETDGPDLHEPGNSAESPALASGDVFQEHITNARADTTQDDYVANTVPDLLDPEVDSQKPSQESIGLGLNNPSESSATSIMSNLNNTPSRSKRLRQPSSPHYDPSEIQSSKSRTRPTARQTAGPPQSSAQPG